MTAEIRLSGSVTFRCPLAHRAAGLAVRCPLRARWLGKLALWEHGTG